MFPLSVFVVLIIASTVLAWIVEHYRWNGGVDRISGQRWQRFDTDSQGGRGYRAADRVIWISWPFIDNNIADARI